MDSNNNTYVFRSMVKLKFTTAVPMCNFHITISSSSVCLHHIRLEAGGDETEMQQRHQSQLNRFTSSPHYDNDAFQ